MLRIVRFLKSIFYNLVVSLRFPSESKIFTHLTSEEKLKLLHLAKVNKGEIFVEIGSYVGASSCFLAAGIGESSCKKIYCVDTWSNDAMSEGKRETYQEFLDNTRKYQNLISPLRGTSTDVANAFNEGVDLLFIDGDHTYEGVKADVDAWLPKLNKNALVIFHDIGWAEGVKRVVDEEIKKLAKAEGRLPNLYWAQL